ncbi:MAG TPA: FecR domain-containing protein [Chitinophagaceae bacterium]
MTGNNDCRQAYASFSEEDFISDEYFQNWVFTPDAKSNQFWNRWMAEHTDKKHIVVNAKKMLQHIGFKEDWPAEERVQASLRQALAHIEQREGRLKGIWRRMDSLWKAAAVFVLVAGLSAVLYFGLRPAGPLEMVYTTDYGKMKSVKLPDGTAIVLNANSKLRVKRARKNKPREVWLEGEAFFTVSHLNRDPRKVEEHERFLVYTSGLTVEVLGTSFNIRKRRGKTEVVLQEGKIMVSYNGLNKPAVVMQPGDLLVYDSLIQQVARKTIVAENYTAWTKKKLILYDPSLKEIISYLEDNFGKRIVLEDKALGARKMEGPILLDTLEDALFVLTTVYNLSVVEKDSSLILRTDQK